METPRSGHRRSWTVALGLAMVLVLPGASAVDRPARIPGRSDAQLSGAQLSGAQVSGAQVSRAHPHEQPSGGAAWATRIAPTRSKKPRTPPTPTPPSPPTPSPSPTPGPAGTSLARINDSHSHLGWASGVYVPGSSPANDQAFGTWRGAPIDVVVDWPARANWWDIMNPDWLYDDWRGTSYTKVFGVAPIPEGDPSATLARCADGAYNDKWTQFGRNIKAAGMDTQSVIRLGWEMNGDWYKWQARNPAQFAECWRQIVGTVKQVAPALIWEWSVNRGVGQSVADARLAYPGDAYVDIVGVDSYDMFPAANTEAGWQQQYAGPYGLKFWADFATAHGKKLSVPEWGLYPGTAHTGNNGGDDPFYIAKMQQFFAGLGDRLAYEAYFNESAPYYAGSLESPAQNPAGAAEYRSLFTNRRTP